MYRTFNCGVGMVLIIDAADADAVISMLNQNGETAWQLGAVETGDNKQVIFSP